MKGRDVALVVGGFALGYAVGYAVCWWKRPLPALASDGGGSKLKNPAKVILDSSDAVQKFRPILAPIAAGQIPSPANIYDIVSGL